ncbi:hypothetical protein [Agreia sp. Leaf210]|uniref:hypothetical protein n=1 Tax=Agreia sp. Leaf210 TaxID=1735682 RepID=UPI0007152247|nr:hypothetical protein [Agreia sp. Leaf210]KQM59343.1 hypothetical protein ASE64_08155 [Agreia sp. Leaf210]
MSAAGCSGSPSHSGGTDGASKSSAPSAPVATADSKKDLEAKLLTLDEIPTGGWAIKPEDTSESPATSSDKSTDDNVCAGDLSSVVNLDPDSAATITFQRRDAEFSEGVAPAENPQEVVADIEAAVTPCFGNPQETTVQGKQAQFELSPLPTTGIDGAVIGYTLSVTINYVKHDLPFFLAAGDGVVVVTSVKSTMGEYVTPDEFVELTQAAVEAAS